MAASSLRRSAIWLCGCAAISVAACEQPARDDMSWAQSALARNPQLQVLSVDRQAHAFTVRLKDSGELRIVQADAVVGVLPSSAAELGVAGAIARGAPEAPPAPAAAQAAPEPAPAVPPAADTAAAQAKGPGVIASGPGYSIRSARVNGAEHAPTSSSAQNDFIAKGLAIERRDEPIVCQGARFLRIDSRNLEFEGDAINAEDGCEIHITNSRIAAKGVGVSARAANVHIVNSSIEGQSGSILASDGAQVYAEGSRFGGVRRGLTAESLHDLGGNVWN